MNLVNLKRLDAKRFEDFAAIRWLDSVTARAMVFVA